MDVLRYGLDAQAEEIDERVKALRERQAILLREQPPRLWAVIGESAIQQAVGGVKVMREQLTHLGELARRQHIVVQVLPHTAGAHPGLTGAFVVFTLPRDPDIVCVENMTGTLHGPTGRTTQLQRRVRSPPGNGPEPGRLTSASPSSRPAPPRKTRPSGACGRAGIALPWYGVVRCATSSA